ncbi:unnamed protein product [Brugia timori]|uniref:LETM1 domain-containing protein n=1 Tax=Brugia timori TaxID=42155 RepID=A0A0R3Q4A3_9BILA|nr:unnamed protein product [Brugia timori]
MRKFSKFWIDGDVTGSKTMFSEHFRYLYALVYSAVQRIPLLSIEVTNNLLSGFRLIPSRIGMNLIQCAVMIAFDPGLGTHRSLMDLSRPRLMEISSDDIKVISSTSSKRL